MSDQHGATTVDVPMAVEKAWHLIQSELPVASWAKGASVHEFSLIDETGHFAFSLVADGHHGSAVIYRTDVAYSDALERDTLDVLETDADRPEGATMSDETERCETCEVRDWGLDSDGQLVPVWENPADYTRGEGPDYIGCTNCGTMRPVGEDADRSGAGP